MCACPKSTMNASFVEYFKMFKLIPKALKFMVTLQQHSPLILFSHISFNMLSNTDRYNRYFEFSLKCFSKSLWRSNTSLSLH